MLSLGTAIGKGVIMILYMDVYITDTPLFKNLYADLDELRSRSKIYKMPSKVDITLYTLTSYALYKWSSVLIKYELEDKSKNDYFEKEIKKIFPNAVIIRGRSDNQTKYQESINIMETMGDEWVFYEGNNDHPLIANNLHLLDKCFEKAKELSKNYKFISVWHSQIQEGGALLEKDTNFWKVLNQNKILKKDIIYEDEDMFVTRRDSGVYMSNQIINLRLLKHWFFDFDLTSKKVRRTDDLADLVKTSEQIVIFPKKQICEHFDGYGNLDAVVGFRVNEVIPPLFIPPGFFKNNIKIAFGYDEYREGWVNINPTKKKYSFADPVHGTDMKIGLNDIPLFWKSRISKIDINPKINQKELEALGNKNYEKICNPWPKSLWRTYITKYVLSPIQKFLKFVKRTEIYIKDPEFLEESKGAGSPLFRIYKHILLSIVKLGKKPKL